tara:strand:- start:481 stop:849 length:369 start_codon:yes stop_codon:yes gene_type:complete
MTKELQDIKIMLEQMYNVPTNIKNRTDLTTGKKLTPVEMNHYHTLGGYAGLKREEVEALLDNGFDTEETVKETVEETVELTPEQQYRLEYIAGMEQWVMNAPNATAFEKRNAYMVKWKANNL